MIDAIVMILLLFQKLANAQSCIILDETSACGKSFIGYPINLPEINSVQRFNTELAKSTDVSAYADFGCRAEEIIESAIPSLRYYNSFWCSAWVADAQKTCTSNKSNSSSLPALCQDQCSLAISSLNSLFKSCSDNSDTKLQNRKLFVDFLNRNCQQFASKQKNDAKSCNVVTDAESKFCGWNSKDVAVANCKKDSSSSCCSSILASQTPSSQLEAWKIAVIVIAVLILILGIVYLFYGTKKKASLGSDRDSEKDNESNAKNPHEKMVLSENRMHTRGSILSLSSVGQISTIGSINGFSETYSLRPELNENYMRVALEQFPTSASDELPLEKGDLVYCLKEFDDGWALGCNPITQEQGVFPIMLTRANNNESVDIFDKRLSYIRKPSIRMSSRSSLASGFSIESIGVNPFRGNGF